ncbi:MAG: hypothetical protein KF851_10485 [Pirellulaceae bacterium]|nr:hypothetical protein [Pirellulaceae bacterium]
MIWCNMTAQCRSMRWFLQILLVLGLGDQFLVGQIGAPPQRLGMINQPHYSISSNAADGKLVLTRLDRSAPDRKQEVVDFLTHPEILAELDLTSRQEQEIQQIVESFQKRLGEILTAVPGGQFQLTDQMLAQLVEAGEEFQQTWEQTLLPHQQSRVRELMNRLNLRRDGIVQVLSGPEMSAALKLNDGQVQKLKETAKTLAAELSDMTRQERSAFLDEMLVALPTEKAQKFRERYEPHIRPRLPAIDIIIWQTVNADEIATKLEKDNLAGEPYGGLFIPSGFSMDVAGRLTNDMNPGMYSAAFMKRNNAEDVPIAKFIFYMSMFSYLLGSSDFSSELDLSGEQIAQLTQLQDEHAERKTLWMTRSSELRSAGKFTPDDGRWEMEDRVRLAGQGLKQMDAILLPHQRDTLRWLAECGELLSGGFPYAAEHGRLGKHLKFTVEEKEKLRDTAERICKRWEEQSLRWEQDAIDRLLDLLDAEQRQALENLIGPPLKHTGCNVDLLIMHLEQTPPRSLYNIR